MGGDCPGLLQGGFGPQIGPPPERSQQVKKWRTTRAFRPPWCWGLDGGGKEVEEAPLDFGGGVLDHGEVTYQLGQQPLLLAFSRAS